MMRFLLLMPEFNEGHFTIDMGIIPQLLAERHRWAVVIASQRLTRMPGNLRSVAFGRSPIGSIRYLWGAARQIDVLQLMHFTWRTIVRCLIFRLRNSRGVCYVKLDMAEPQMRLLEGQVRCRLWRMIYRWGLDRIDLISVETTAMQARFQRLVAACKPRRVPSILRVPSCGYDLDLVLSRASNGFALGGGPDLLYVGRLGAWQKAIDVLLESFRILTEVLDVPATLRLVGRADEQFGRILDDWRRRVASSTWQRVSISAPIRDRLELMDVYLGARVFVISSRYEGIPNVVVEAASCGCRLASTPVGQVPDVLLSGASGWTAPIDAPEAMARAMANALKTRDTADKRLERIRVFKASYAWPAVIDQLSGALSVLVASKAGNAGRHPRTA